MSKIAENMKPGSRFITLTKPLVSNAFEILDRRQYAMSWGAATAYIHARLVTEAYIHTYIFCGNYYFIFYCLGSKFDI